SPSGNLIWSTNQIGSGRNVAVGTGRSVYVSTYISTNNQWLVVKYSELGAFLWQKPGLPDSLMRVDKQENVIITAVANNPASSNWNLVITKYGSDGSALWTRNRYYDNSRFYLGDSRLDANNAIYLAGAVETNSPTSRLISLLKYSPDGDLQWEMKYA